ncbi:MAG: hypothetical protein V3V02_04785 [Rhizobiaceae bacterium]
MKPIEIKAGKRTRILRTFSNSLAMRYRFSAKPLKKDDKISGKVEVKGSNWLFPRKAIIQKLEANNQANKRAWDTFYSIYVTPECDIKITFSRSRLRLKPLFIAAAIAIIILAVALVWLGKNGQL